MATFWMSSIESVPLIVCRKYSWVSYPQDPHWKLICHQTKAATNNPRTLLKPLKNTCNYGVYLFVNLFILWFVVHNFFKNSSSKRYTAHLDAPFCDNSVPGLTVFVFHLVYWKIDFLCNQLSKLCCAKPATLKHFERRRCHRKLSFQWLCTSNS